MSSFITTGLYSFYLFIILTFILFIVKYLTGDSIIINILYYLALIVSQYFINLNTTNTICGEYQYVNALLVTVIPWTIIFGLLNIILKIYPGWLSPFSNTIGYSIAKLAGVGTLLNNILVTSENDETKKIISNIYNDKSLLINEINTYNFNTFWKKMVDSNIFNNNEKYKLDLLKLVKLKELVSEMTWYLLTGILISSITYNYLLNAECNKSQDRMKELENDYINKNKDLLASNNDVVKRLYTSTE